MHVRKFAAAMQNASAGSPVFLGIESNSGPGGADLVCSTLEREADKWAFFLGQMGLELWNARFVARKLAQSFIDCNGDRCGKVQASDVRGTHRNAERMLLVRLQRFLRQAS
jgi:hypothetical protein